MTTGRESICCHEEPKTDPKIHGDHLCITEEQEFHMVCINETVVRTAMVVFVHDHGAIPDAPETESVSAFLISPHISTIICLCLILFCFPELCVTLPIGNGQHGYMESLARNIDFLYHPVLLKK